MAIQIKAFALSVVAGLALGGGIGMALGGIDVTPRARAPVAVKPAVTPNDRTPAKVRRIARRDGRSKAWDYHPFWTGLKGRPSTTPLLLPPGGVAVWPNPFDTRPPDGSAARPFYFQQIPR